MFEYVKPQAEILKFLQHEPIATEDDVVNLPGQQPSLSEGVEDWENLN